MVTNSTYDGLCYDVNRVVEELSKSVPRIHFDEAWYAYAKFHEIYRGRFAMDVPDDMPDRPHDLRGAVDAQDAGGVFDGARWSTSS